MKITATPVLKLSPARTQVSHRSRSATVRSPAFSKNAKPATEHRRALTDQDHNLSDQRFRRMHNAALVDFGDASNTGKHQKPKPAIVTVPAHSDSSRINTKTPSTDNAIKLDAAPAWARDHLPRFTQQISASASDATTFKHLLHAAFGTSIRSDKAEQLRQNILQNDFSWLPNIHYVSGAKLNGADGAYAASLHAVFINAEMSNAASTDMAYQVLLEEIGHALDTLLNTQDSLGDEGALFAAKLTGDTLSVEELNRLRTDNDAGFIEINGEHISVEYSWASKEFGRATRRVKRFVLSLAADVGKLVNLLRNVKNAIDGLARSLTQITITVLKRPIEIALEWQGGLHKATGHLLRGDLSSAANALRASLVNSGQLAASLAPEISAMVLSTLLLTIDRIRGGVSERGLQPTERSYLHSIFGNNIDYDKVTIVSGGFKQQLGMDPHVLGNQIYLPKHFENEQILTAQNSVTPEGLHLLAHEAAHVWQFQNQGSGYITESLVRQFYDGDNDTYDWQHAVLAGTEFVDMNPEQQAEIARIIGEAIEMNTGRGLAAELTQTSLQAVVAGALPAMSTDQFQLFQDAHYQLRPALAPTNIPVNPVPVASQRVV